MGLMNQSGGHPPAGAGSKLRRHGISGVKKIAVLLRIFILQDLRLVQSIQGIKNRNARYQETKMRAFLLIKKDI